MSNSESDSEREGEQFLYDDNNIIYPKRIHRRSKTSLHVMTINNAYYKTTQNNETLRAGFNTWRENMNREQSTSVCDCCFHSVICSFIIVLIHKTVIDNFLSIF
jgi:hypothetical protein